MGYYLSFDMNRYDKGDDQKITKSVAGALFRVDTFLHENILSKKNL